MRAILGLGSALAAIAASNSRKVFGAENIRRVITQTRKGKRYGNTSRYQPHQGKREIARRLQQQQRDIDNQIARAKRAGVREFHGDTELAVGLTRSGRKVFYTAA